MPLRRRLRRNGRDFHRLQATFAGKREADAQPAVREYLASANLVMTALSDTLPLHAKLAFLPGLTFAHVVTPPLTIDWPRDRASRDRAVIVLVNVGAVSIETTSAYIQREPGLSLILPGQDHVRVRLTDPQNELVFISFGSALLSDVALATTARTRLAPLGRQAVTPFFAFARSLTGINVTDAEEVAGLIAASRGVIRSLARKICSGRTEERTPFSAALEIIRREYSDRGTSVASVAAKLDLAPRTLQAVFAARGTTLSRELRMVRAHAALRARRHNPHLNAGLIMAMVGFGSESAMFRAIREFEGVGAAADVAATGEAPTEVGDQPAVSSATADTNESTSSSLVSNEHIQRTSLRDASQS